MRRLIPTLLTLIWGLWFGGLVTLFLVIGSLFKTLPRETAGQGATQIFHLFNAYQLALAVLSLIFTFIWRLIGPPKRTTLLFGFFAIATLLACLVTIYLAPQIEHLQQAGQTSSEAFNRYHEWSTTSYTAQVVALLLAGLLLPFPPSPKST